MTDDETDESNAEGEKVDTNSKEVEEINPILAEAKSLAERIEEGNKRSEDLLNKQEKLLAEQALGGTSNAGQTSEPKEENPKEYMDRIDKEIGEGKEDGFT